MPEMCPKYTGKFPKTTKTRKLGQTLRKLALQGVFIFAKVSVAAYSPIELFESKFNRER